MGCILLHHLTIATLLLLVASLDGTPDITVAEAWNTEICCKINDIKSGKTELLDAAEAIARARTRIRS
jgi:hypothetical protein